MTDTLHVTLPAQPASSYAIHVGNNLEQRIAADLAARPRRHAVVCDHTTRDIFARTLAPALEAQSVDHHVLAVPPGEDTKDLARFLELLEAMRGLEMHRGDVVVAFGGGVVGDLAGFAAGCYMRGIPCIQMPTTLLAQVDSSVGGKVAVNIPRGKNYCGLFAQPEAVYIDLERLRGLPAAELRNGLAEVVKYACIDGGGLGPYLLANADRILALDMEPLRHVVLECCRIKADIVSRDATEADARRLLNHGHTVGHAIEEALGHTLPHGLCVAYGIRAMARLGRDLGCLDEEAMRTQLALLDAFGLALEPLALDVGTIFEFMKKDKKARRGALVLVVPTGAGSVVIREDVPLRALEKALEESGILA